MNYNTLKFNNVSPMVQDESFSVVNVYYDGSYYNMKILTRDTGNPREHALNLLIHEKEILEYIYHDKELNSNHNIDKHIISYINFTEEGKKIIESIYRENANKELRNENTYFIQNLLKRTWVDLYLTSPFMEYNSLPISVAYFIKKSHDVSYKGLNDLICGRKCELDATFELQLLKGIHYLYTRNIVLYDLSLDNIVIVQKIYKSKTLLLFQISSFLYAQINPKPTDIPEHMMHSYEPTKPYDTMTYGRDIYSYFACLWLWRNKNGREDREFNHNSFIKSEEYNDLKNIFCNVTEIDTNNEEAFLTMKEPTRDQYEYIYKKIFEHVESKLNKINIDNMGTISNRYEHIGNNGKPLFYGDMGYVFSYDKDKKIKIGVKDKKNIEARIGRKNYKNSIKLLDDDIDSVLHEIDILKSLFKTTDAKHNNIINFELADDNVRSIILQELHIDPSNLAYCYFINDFTSNTLAICIAKLAERYSDRRSLTRNKIYEGLSKILEAREARLDGTLEVQLFNALYYLYRESIALYNLSIDNILVTVKDGLVYFKVSNFTKAAINPKPTESPGVAPLPNVTYGNDLYAYYYTIWLFNNLKKEGKERFLKTDTYNNFVRRMKKYRGNSMDLSDQAYTSFYEKIRKEVCDATVFHMSMIKSRKSCLIQSMHTKKASKVNKRLSRVKSNKRVSPPYKELDNNHIGFSEA